MGDRQMKAYPSFLFACITMFSLSPAEATTYTVTFDNVIIDNNPNYTVTGSFLFDSSQVNQPGYGLSNFNVQAVTPYGVFDIE
jgi:hypothetical protein